MELCMVETLLVRNSAGKVDYLCSQLERMTSLRNLIMFGMGLNGVELVEWCVWFVCGLLTCSVC
jgi:hypothetical protein